MIKFINTRSIIFFIFLILACVIFFGLKVINAAEENVVLEPAEIAKADINFDEIYYFYQPACHHCIDAQNFISKNLANVPMKKINITNREGMNLFLEFAKYHGVSRFELGTPFISVGKNYILGWGENAGAELQKYIDLQKINK